jgi:hypothetical protein
MSDHSNETHYGTQFVTRAEFDQLTEQCLAANRAFGAMKEHRDAETQRADVLQAWKAGQQQALTKQAVMLLNAGYKGDGINDGIEWLIERANKAEADAATANNLLAQQVESNKRTSAELSKAEERGVDSCADKE